MSEAHPTAPTPTVKPAKPSPEFPLFPHATRRWAKKIRGKMHYFGPWDDPTAALEEFLRQRDDLYAGRDPNASKNEPKLSNLVNQFLTSKRLLMEGGELSALTWRDYYDTCARM